MQMELRKLQWRQCKHQVSTKRVFRIRSETQYSFHQVFDVVFFFWCKERRFRRSSVPVTFAFSLTNSAFKLDKGAHDRCISIDKLVHWLTIENGKLFGLLIGNVGILMCYSLVNVMSVNVDNYFRIFINNVCIL